MERRVLLVAERPVRDVDLESPRQRGRPAEQLLVEVVAPATDRLREHDARCDRVHEREHVEVAPASDEDDTAIAPPATAPQIDRPPFQISNAPTTPLSLHLYPVNRW